METRRLEVFCKVVELKSFTRAAEAVMLSQPSVSEHVRLLEEAFDEKLLDRLGREVLPTPAGKILYQYARRITQLLGEAVQSVEHFKGHLAGQLCVGASTIPGGYILPQMIVSFRDIHPDIRVMLEITGTSKILGRLLDGSIEIAIVGARPDDKRIESSELLEDELVLAVPAGHRWAVAGSVYAADLTSEPFILREQGSGTRTVLTNALSAHGFDTDRLQVVAEMGSTEAVRQGIKAGLGLSILSARAIREDLKNGSLTRVAIHGLKISRPLFLVHRKARQLSPLAAVFLDHLCAQSSSL